MKVTIDYRVISLAVFLLDWRLERFNVDNMLVTLV